jgi:hypothetical protein
MKISRHYTTPNHDPYAEIEFRLSKSEIRDPDGSMVFSLDEVEVPLDWSQVATDILAQKYFRRAGVPARVRRVEEDGIPSFLSRTAIPPPAPGAAKGILSYASSVWPLRARYHTRARSLQCAAPAAPAHRDFSISTRHAPVQSDLGTF